MTAKPDSLTTRLNYGRNGRDGGHQQGINCHPAEFVSLFRFHVSKPASPVDAGCNDFDPLAIDIQAVQHSDYLSGDRSTKAIT